MECALLCMRAMRAPVSTLLSIALSFSFAACSDEHASSEDLPEHLATDASDKNLLVRVNRGAEQSISFHAFEPGAIVVTQTGSKKAFPLELSEDPILAFQQAAPDHAVPEVLTRASRAPEPGARSVSTAALVPDEPVILDLEAPIEASAFPPGQFTCWARNRHTCLFNKQFYRDTAGNDFRHKTLNTVWAVDKHYIAVMIHATTTGGSHDIWQYETWDGYWRTWSLTGPFAILIQANESVLNPTSYYSNFHYSSAGPQ